MLEIQGHLVQFCKLTSSAVVDGDCFLANFNAILDELDDGSGCAEGIKDAHIDTTPNLEEANMEAREGFGVIVEIADLQPHAPDGAEHRRSCISTVPSYQALSS